MQKLLEVTVYTKHENFVSGRGYDLNLECKFCYKGNKTEVVFININDMVEHHITSIIGILTFIANKGYNLNYFTDLDINVKTWGEPMKYLVDNFKLHEYVKVFSLVQKLK